jgi:hypothetical protein
LNLPEQWKETFPQVLTHASLLEAWVAQLEKDLSGFDANGTTNPPEVLTLLRSWVEAMLDKYPDKLMASMYRADVSEFRVRAMIVDEVDAPAAIAWLLAEREAKKVWFRQQFGKG